MNLKQLQNIIKESIRQVLFEKDIMDYFDIDNIPEDELRKQYVDFSIFLRNKGFGGRFSTIGGKIISEEANATLSVEETKKEILDKFPLKDWQFCVDDTNEDIKLIVLFPGIFRNSQKIIKAMNACGWYVSTKSFKWVHNMLWQCISFDPMFLNNISNEVRKYRYLYHWTPSYNLESILKSGLKPKSENTTFDYPERVHLLPGNLPLIELLNIGEQLCNHNKNRKNNGDYVLLQISTKDLPLDMEFFPDPRYVGGFYTESPIPLSLIKVTLKENFDSSNK